MTRGEREFAIRKALNMFDEWNDVTGCFPKGQVIIMKFNR